MSIFLVFVTLFIAVCLMYFKQMKRAAYFLLFSFFFVFMIGTGALPAIFLKRLQSPFVTSPQINWKNNNLIVLLAGGLVKNPATDTVTPGVGAYSRIYETAKLYFSCLAHATHCTIIVSGGDPYHNGISEAETYKRLLEQLNIKSEDILIETQSRNTFENARFVSNLIDQDSIDQVVLVTSGIHLKRALLYFSHFHVAPLPAASDFLYPKFGFIPTSYNFMLMDYAIHEYLGRVRFYVYNFFGLNNKQY
jgi:uncharacterized SAM-binding protein YcdF (DUF218 family)